MKDEVKAAGAWCQKCNGMHRVPQSAMFMGRIVGIHHGCKRYVERSTNQRRKP